MSYTIKAIPTVYNHVQFRSRLEARWAAFFDLCGWQWEYEPFDLDGWAPDFMLKGAVRALVEVKPINFRGDDHSLVRQAKAKADKAFATADRVSLGGVVDVESMSDGELIAQLGKDTTPEYEILVIGNGPFFSGKMPRWSLGVFALDEWDSGPDVADIFVGRGRPLDYAARSGSFRYRISGHHDGDHHLRPVDGTLPQDIWREAGNVVQWKSPRQSKRAA